MYALKMYVVQVSDFQTGITNVLVQLSTLHKRKNVPQIFRTDNTCPEMFSVQYT